ncbi:hypothetical protein GCM10020358_81300 [Amorphoplanes nipponensis]|uniref:Uncharacterized protein n=1 Tax=Actinoplanes nipponensis TaxID=135950 RepID=A0A919MKF5_9ACTN|nr:hypothetical protein [Actinoplanes nipponensis]GIE47677.1 hypothetical protein Ani05nite_12110 [Actinoplanes nipponensis]
METLGWSDCVGIAPARRVGRVRRSPRLDRRGRLVLAVAATVAVLVNSGAAWAYWRLDAAAAAPAPGGPVELTLQARSDDGAALSPGAAVGLTVTVTNRYAFPVRVVAVRAGSGAVTADPAHHDAGCRGTGLAVAADSRPVSWEVPRNTIGVFIMPGALRMTGAADPACRGAVFTVPVRATGVGASS